MKNIDQIIKEDWFGNHVAEYKEINDMVSILEWKESGTNMYRVRYVMDGSYLYISGDLGTAVFSLTWKATPKSFQYINLGYFHEKLTAYHGEKWSFSSEEAKNSLQQSKEIWLEEGVKEENLEVFDKLKGLADECRSNKEWEFRLSESGLYDDLLEVEPDAWDWIFITGQDYPNRVKSYLIGLKMAYEQLNK